MKQKENKKKKLIRVMNKKGSSLSLWTEVILLSLLIVVMLGMSVGEYNRIYGKSNSLGLGMNETELALVNYQDSLANEMKGGEADFNSVSGLTLGTSWNMIKSLILIVWSFITGGWTETLVNYMNLPIYVALIFRILYFISLGAIALFILFKVRP